MDSFSTRPLLSDQVNHEEIRILTNILKGQLENSVELGCYVGTTSVFLQRTLVQLHSQKKLYVYDSFAGLPDKKEADRSPVGEQFKAGELKTSKQVFIKNFLHAGLPLPVIRKGWFRDLTASDMPQKICFAFLDGDFYDSIHDSLKLVWALLAEGAVVIVDDYQSEPLPGVTAAVDDWLRSHPAKKLSVQQSVAIIQP